MHLRTFSSATRATASFILLAVLLSACTDSIVPTLPPLPPFVPPPDQTLPTATPSSDQAQSTAAPSPQPAASETIQVYFTDPTRADVDVFSGGPDELLAGAIDQARLSLDIAVYDFNLWSLQDAILAAHQRGVAVRLITESDNLDEQEIQELKEAGIPLLADRRQGYMHNKFAVIDRLDVWTGSMNYTVNDAYRNNNNLVHIRSQEMAANYTTEFEEMWAEDLFGRDDRPQTPFQVFKVNETLVEVYFSPDDHTADRILELIFDAQESIYFLAFSFTSDDIAQAVVDKQQAGVTVAGIFEESQVNSNNGGEYENLVAAGLDVHLDGNNRNMHHKVFIIDGSIVITGSYNFSANAEEQNDENTVVIHNAGVAGLFIQEFERLLAESKTR